MMHPPLFRTVLLTFSRVISLDSENVWEFKFVPDINSKMSAFSITIFGTSGGKIMTKSHFWNVAPKPHQLATPYRPFSTSKGMKPSKYVKWYRQFFRFVRLRLEKLACGISDVLLWQKKETAENVFLACGLYKDIRSEDSDSLNLLDPENCNTIVDYISQSTVDQYNKPSAQWHFIIWPPSVWCNLKWYKPWNITTKRASKCRILL